MFDIAQQYLDPDSGEIDDRKLGRYIDGLMDAFAESPEARPLIDKGDGVHWTAMVVQYAATHLGVTVPGMSKRDLDEILFELFPRKVSTGADSAGAIVAEQRAFWQFAQRQYGLGNAAAMLALLGPGAESRLQRALADPSNFGMAKSFFMMGQEAGFDMGTQEGMNAFLRVYNASLAGAPLPTEGPDDDFDDEDLPPLPGPRGPVDKQKLRKARKAQRQARKRGRKR